MLICHPFTKGIRKDSLTIDNNNNIIDDIISSMIILFIFYGLTLYG